MSEALLKRRFDRYAELLDAMREGFMVLDREFQVVEMNAFGISLDGRPFEELHGRTHWELWPASVGTQVERAYRKVMAERMPVSLRHHYLADQHDHWLEITAYPVSEGVAVLYSEVTPVVQGESYLRQSEARFRAAVAAVGVMWTNDASGRMKGAQPGWAELTGQSETEYQDYGWASAVHPEDAQPTIDAWNRAVAEKRTFEFEHRIRRHDGEWRKFSIRAVPVTEDGEIHEWVGVHIDVTEAKQIEADLRASEERRRLALDSAELGAWNIDPAKQELTADERFCTIFAGSPAALSYVQAVQAVHADDRAGVSAAIAAAIRPDDPAPYAVEYRVIHPDGTVRWVHAKGRANFEGTGADRRLLSFDGTVADITDGKLADERLRISESRFRTLFESIDEGFCVIEMMFDADGLPYDFRFLEANPAFERHNGLHDAVGKTMRDFAPDMDPIFFEIYGRVAKTGEPIRFTSESKALGRWFDIYAFRVGEATDGKVAVLFTDISARRRGEEDLRRAAAELSETDRRKDEFLATLAHELRNPLAAIRTGLEVVARSPGDAQRAQRVVGMVERQSRLLVKLVDDLMDVSRVATGKVVLQQDRIDLRAVLELGMEVGQTAFDASTHDIRLELPAGPMWIRGDASRLAQVVGNLVNNASKYTPDGGRITVSLDREGAEAVLRISDTGAGIPPEQLNQVFAMFTQVDRTLDRARGGLGIGLSLVRRLVELHGGTVNAFSEGIGRGSTFIVRLPFISESIAQDGGDLPLAVPRPTKHLRILVIDDNHDIADGLAALLNVEGHETRTAYDGVSGLEEAIRFEPDIVFCDIGMPGLSGHEVARRLRSSMLSKTLFLVAVTGWGSEEDRRLTLEAGFDIHCTKPVNAEHVDMILARF